MTTLKRVASLRAGGTPSVDDPNMWSESEEEGIGWVSIGDMSDGKPVSTTVRRVSERGVESKRLPIGEPGTLLFAMYASVGAVGRLATRATWNQALLGIAPRPGLSDERFIRYWLEHLRPSLGALTRSNTQDNLNAEQVGNFPFPDMALAEQRAIADYLDAETARIDALIAKKQQLTQLLEERLSVEVETAIRRLGVEHGLAPLKHFAGSVTVGIVITPAKWYVEHGVPAVRGMNVSPGLIDMTEAVFLSGEGHEANSKSTLREGDLVVVRTGQAGAAAVVPSELDGANCIDLLIVRPAPGVRSRFLEYVLNSDWTIKHIGEHSVGSIQAHFNVGSLREVPVPTPPTEVQDEVVASLDRVTSQHRSAITSLGGQLGLLTEHRRALISASVAGESLSTGAG